MSLDTLQVVIDTSLSSASPLARKIYANHAWSASMLQRYINRVMGATVATVRNDGRPHAVLTLCCCLNGDLYITVSDGSLLLRHLENRADVALTVTDHEHDVAVFGTAGAVGRTRDIPDLVHEMHRVSRRGQFMPVGWDGWIYAIDPQRLFISK